MNCKCGGTTSSYETIKYWIRKCTSCGRVHKVEKPEETDAQIRT